MAIGPEMRKLNNEVKSGAVSFDRVPLPRVDGDAEARMEALRPHLYVVSGLIVPFALKHLINLKDTYPPFGVPKDKVDSRWIPRAVDRTYAPWEGIREFNQLYQGLINAAKLTANDFTVPEEYRPVANRLNELVEMAHEIEPDEIRYTSPREFMKAGLNTAIEMTVGAHAGVYTLGILERGRNRQDFIDIAGRSSRLSSVIAAVNIDHTGSVRRAIHAIATSKSSPNIHETLPYFNPNVLRFFPDAESPEAYVDFFKPLEQLIDPLTMRKIADVKKRFPTLTCPAMPKFGEEDSQVKVFWNHITNLSADVKYKDS